MPGGHLSGSGCLYCRSSELPSRRRNGCLRPDTALTVRTCMDTSPAGNQTGRSVPLLSRTQSPGQSRVGPWGTPCRLHGTRYRRLFPPWGTGWESDDPRMWGHRAKGIRGRCT